MGARLNSYSWAPDSRSIALADDRYGNYDIYRVAMPTAALTRLTTDALNEVYPSWTPDGKRIVFVQLDDPWLTHIVFAIDADGKGPRTEIVRDANFFDYAEGGTFGYPQVSPEGSTLLFRSHRSGWINYWVVPMSGGAPRPAAAEAADQSGAAWSPDGKSILYLAMWNGTQDLRIVSAAGRAWLRTVPLDVPHGVRWGDGERSLGAMLPRAEPHQAGQFRAHQGLGNAITRMRTESQR